jgi:hypothetical protein
MNFKKFFLFAFFLLVAAAVIFFNYGRLSKAVVADSSLPAASDNIPAPKEFRGIYLTGWSAGLKSRIDYVIALSKTAGVNAVVIDVKDYSGYVSYKTANPEVQKYSASQKMVADMPGTIKKLHQAGIYTIARVTCFQDPVLARARPDLAIHRKSDQAVWLDNKGLAWIDPSKQGGWDYIVSIAKDAYAQGFDEVNFDYVRFPSDGDLKNMSLDNITSESDVIESFFKYAREQLPYSKISADLFGLATVRADDLGIGQVIESAYKYFDYVCPMVYPSHYEDGFNGYANPADYPYEVVSYSMSRAEERMNALKKEYPDLKLDAKLRPWLQNFDMGATYDTPKVLAQMKAVKDSLGDDYSGYLLWSPGNRYDEEAIKQSDGF